MLDGCFRNVFYTPCDKKCGKSCLNGYKVLILHRISRRGFFPDAKVDKFGCLQPPEKMLKLHRSLCPGSRRTGDFRPRRNAFTEQAPPRECGFLLPVQELVA